eukprot:scaffold294247_cov15-Tisochrysis_lutea.AAC.2
MDLHAKMHIITCTNHFISLVAVVIQVNDVLLFDASKHALDPYRTRERKLESKQETKSQAIGAGEVLKEENMAKSKLLACNEDFKDHEDMKYR